MMSSKKYLLLATCAVLALAACSKGHEDGRMAGQLPPPHPLDAPPPLPLAAAHGIDNTYFNAELQDAMQRVQSMRAEMETLNGKLAALQTRLSGVAADASMPVSVPASFPGAPVDEPGQSTTVTTTTTGTLPADAAITTDGPIAVGPTAMTTQPVTTQTTVTTQTAAAPTQITGTMGTPAVADTKVTPMKPVVEGAKAEAKAKDSAVKNASGVNAVRLGTHGDTVRVVLDVTGSADGAKPELDAADNIMTITLPKTKWAGTSTQKITNNPVIASYSAQPSGEGSVVAFSLKGATRIVSSSVLKNPTRVVVDLAK